MTKRFTVAAILGPASLAVALFAADTAREQKLQQAIDLMESKGDLAKAIPMFEDAARSPDRALGARALLYLGQAEERQGADKARATYERIVKEFGAQTQIAAAAQQRLAALGGSRGSGVLANRFLCAECADDESDISADGRLMVLTDWDNSDLAIRDMSTGAVRRLFTKPASLKDDSFPETPVFSPDSKQVAYCWWENNHVELRIMPAEPGSKARTVLNSPEITWYTVSAWFPDGKSVLVFLEKKDQTTELSRVSVSDGTITQLKPLEWRRFSGAQFSPDGKYIVYSASAMNPKQPLRGSDPLPDEHIWVLAADGSGEREIVKTSGLNRRPIWTPDGKHVLFLSDRSGQFDLWSLEVRNGREVGIASLIRPGVGDIEPLGFVAGSYYYDSRQQSAEFINIVDARNPNAKPLETFVGAGPAWSPDGKSIAFKRKHPGVNTPRISGVDYDLVVHSLETGEERLYPTSLGFTGNGAPVWFHDNQSLGTGLHGSSGRIGPHRIDLKHGEWTKLPIIGGLISLDDRTVYTSRKANNMPVRIMSNDIATGQERQIIELPGTGQINGPTLALSPDGSTLALAWMDRFHTNATRLHIATVSVDGSNFHEIFARNDTLFGGGSVVWSKDGRSVFFNQEQPGGASHWAIMRVPADGSAPPSVLGPGPSNGGGGWFDLSPDGSRFAIGTGTQATDELWSLENVLAAIK